MIRFKLADDQGRWAIVDNTDDAIMWMIGKTGISVEVVSDKEGISMSIPKRSPCGALLEIPTLEIPTVGKVS